MAIIDQFGKVLQQRTESYGLATTYKDSTHLDNCSVGLPDRIDMIYLWQIHGKTFNEVAELTKHKYPTVVRIIRSFQACGFVEKQYLLKQRYFLLKCRCIYSANMATKRANWQTFYSFQMKDTLESSTALESQDQEYIVQEERDES